MTNRAERPSLGALAGRFLLVGATSFGGGLTAHLRRALVEDMRWLTNDEFLEALSVAQAVPGPNAINLAIYSGWRMRGAAGACVATAAVMLVPLVFVSALAAGWASWAASPRTAGVLRALGAFGVGLMAATAASMLRAARLRAADLTIAAAAFVAVGLLRWSVPAVLVAATAVSLLVPRGAEVADA
jgi:chromate transporter